MVNQAIMEDSEIVFQKQTVSKSQPKIGKPPTRLQKQAPSSLQMDWKQKISSGCKPVVIPLLSPLVEPPEPEFMFPTRNEKDKTAALVVTGGWQHPAAAGCMESSALLSNFFQSKCVL